MALSYLTEQAQAAQCMMLHVQQLSAPLFQSSHVALVPLLFTTFFQALVYSICTSSFPFLVLVSYIHPSRAFTGTHHHTSKCQVIKLQPVLFGYPLTSSSNYG